MELMKVTISQKKKKIQFLQGKLKHEKGVVNGKKGFMAKAFFLEA